MTRLLTALDRWIESTFFADVTYEFSSAAYGAQVSRRGGESHTPRPRPDVSASRPGGCRPSLAECLDFYCPPSP